MISQQSTEFMDDPEERQDYHRARENLSFVLLFKTWELTKVLSI